MTKDIKKNRKVRRIEASKSLLKPNEFVEYQMLVIIEKQHCDGMKK